MAGEALRVSLLGPLAVHRCGQPVGPGPGLGKPRALLLVLAVNANTTVSKSALIDRLWQTPPPSARNLVEKYVSTWRKVLDDGRLETVGAGYRLTLDAESCDLLEAQELIARGRAARQAGRHALAADEFAAAVRLWSPGFEDAFADTAPDPERLRLVELYLGALEDWAVESLPIAPAEPEQIDLLARAHGDHPARERLTELVMRAFAGRDRQAEALAAYDLTRRYLSDELGQAPGSSLQDMHLRVLRQDPSLRPGRATDRRAVRLPPRNPGFVGRDRELLAVHDLLTGRDAVATVALCGLVGTGKSALALEYAHRHGSDYQLVWWIDATSGASTAAGLEELAVRLGSPLPQDREPNLYQLWDALRRVEKALLVFDDATSAGELADHLPPPGVADVLITSMNPEWRRVAVPLRVDVLTAEESADLLRRRMSSDGSTTVQTLAAELGHLPLALSQAAAYIDRTDMPAAQYLQLFRRRRAQLLQRGLPDDHRDTIETTWRLARADLAAAHPAAVQLVQLCSLLASANIPLDLLRAEPTLFPAELAAAAGDDVGLEDVIGEVRRYSLLSRDGDRLQMHCLVQTVVADSLTLDERRSWRARAGAALRALAPRASGIADRQRWEAIVPHLREIVRSAREDAAAPAELSELARRGAGYLAARAAFDDAVDLMSDAQALTEAQAADPRDVSVGRGLTELGALLEQAGRLKAALRTQQDALEILQATSPADDPWVARALGGLTSVLTCHSGVSLWRPDELAEAERRFEAALAVLEPVLTEHHPEYAKILSGLGQVRQDRGDLVGGRACQERALAIVEDLFGPDHPEVGHTCDKLGYVLALLGEYDRSRACYERAARVLAEAYGPDDTYVGWSYSNLGVMLHGAGDLDAADRYQQQARDIFLARDEPIAVRISEWRLARIELARGRFEVARALLEPVVDGLVDVLGDGHADVSAARADLARTQGYP